MTSGACCVLCCGCSLLARLLRRLPFAPQAEDADGSFPLRDHHESASRIGRKIERYRLDPSGTSSQGGQSPRGSSTGAGAPGGFGEGWEKDLRLRHEAADGWGGGPPGLHPPYGGATENDSAACFPGGGARTRGESIARAQSEAVVSMGNTTFMNDDELGDSEAEGDCGRRRDRTEITFARSRTVPFSGSAEDMAALAISIGS